jgi:hypothetical protein
MIVKLMAQFNSKIKLLLLLGLDTLLTAALAAISAYLALLMMWWSVAIPVSLLHHPSAGLIFGSLISNRDFRLAFRLMTHIHKYPWLRLNLSGNGLFFYSAFFTSIWVWLYLVSIGLIRVVHKVRFVWIKIEPYL